MVARQHNVVIIADPQKPKMYLCVKFGCFTSSGFGGVHNQRKKQPDRLKFGSGTKTTDKV